MDGSSLFVWLSLTMLLHLPLPLLVVLNGMQYDPQTSRGTSQTLFNCANLCTSLLRELFEYIPSTCWTDRQRFRTPPTAPPLVWSYLYI